MELVFVIEALAQLRGRLAPPPQISLIDLDISPLWVI